MCIENETGHGRGSATVNATVPQPHPPAHLSIAAIRLSPVETSPEPNLHMHLPVHGLYYLASCRARMICGRREAQKTEMIGGLLGTTLLPALCT